MKCSKLFGILAFTGMVSGCTVDATTGDEAEDALGTAAEAVVQEDWIGPISEEANIRSRYCPVYGEGVIGGQCTGKRCDNNFLDCSPLPLGASVINEFYDTPYISEEGPTNWIVCDGNTHDGVARGIVVGMQATGAYSDNISLHCQTTFLGLHGPCAWTPYFSEEQSAVYFTNTVVRSYAAGIRCRNANCDQVSYWVCQAG